MALTVAGGGGGTLYGYVDDVGTAAKFFYPEGLASTSTGDIIVADTYNHLIRRVFSSGDFEKKNQNRLCAHLIH